VIHPRHEAGKVSAGPSKSAKLESVFRRRDVHVCRTADVWYRRGRDVRGGEQPLKRVVSRKRDHDADRDEDDDEEAKEGMALYAEFQTRLYEPPPATDKIPRNAFGNLDVYVPSMIPAGAVHVRHPLAGPAARVLGIEYADAVTGFEFRGRHGTAVVDGVVVGADMTRAMVEVVKGLESQAADEADEARRKVILGLWRRWLTALRVRDRVHRQYGDREDRDGEGRSGADHKAEDDDEDEDETYQDDSDGGGGFVPEAAEPPSTGQPPRATTETEETLPSFLKQPVDKLFLLPPEVVRQEVVVVRSPNKLPKPGPEPEPKTSPAEAVSEETGEPGHHPTEDVLFGDDDVDGQGGGFVVEDENEGGGFLPNDAESGGGFVAENDNPLGGGGFVVPEETDPTRDGGGGFLVEDGQKRDEVADAADAESQTATAGTGQDDPTKEDLVDPTWSTTEAPFVAVQEAHSPPAPAPDSPESLTPTSLLSHDPDEDDAEPEWLNSLE
jgi:xeroderma pigmentosum group C-complementing protein